MRDNSWGRNVLILLGVFFAYSVLTTPMAFFWTNKVVGHWTYESILGGIVFRTADLLPFLVFAILAGAAARIYLLSETIGGWLAALCCYIAVTHFVSYRGIFRQLPLSFRLAAAVESAVLVGAVLAGAAIAARRIRVGAA